MVVMASQMMHYTHNFELNPREINKRTKRRKHKWNGEMEGNGMRKLMVVGEKIHATWRVAFSKMSVLAAT